MKVRSPMFFTDLPIKTDSIFELEKAYSPIVVTEFGISNTPVIYELLKAFFPIEIKDDGNFISWILALENAS